MRATEEVIVASLAKDMARTAAVAIKAIVATSQMDVAQYFSGVCNNVRISRTIHNVVDDLTMIDQGQSSTEQVNSRISPIDDTGSLIDYMRRQIGSGTDTYSVLIRPDDSRVLDSAAGKTGVYSYSINSSQDIPVII